MRIIKEFREFAVRGNVIDMAVGVMIGTAFGKIVSSLVKDIVMPAFGFFLGRVDFSKLRYVLRDARQENGQVLEPVITIDYGTFLQVSFDFVIISVCLFIVIKAVNQLRRKADDPSEKSVPTPPDVELLGEIRDLLRQQAHGTEKN